MIKWPRSTPGEGVTSKCGKFRIVPEYIGTGRPQAYVLHGGDRYNPIASGDTIRQCKLEAERISLVTVK